MTNTKNTQAPQEAATTTLTPAEEKKASASKRFTDMIMAQYSNAIGTQHFTDREKNLIKGYFIAIDEMLRTSEAERIRKNTNNRNHEYDNNLPYNWNTINLPQLALDLAHYARMGLDMQQDNHLFPIPYKDNKGNQYTITLMEGYNGIRYQAEKYAVTPPTNVVTQVVHEHDKFTAIMKGKNNPGDTYTFEIPQPFNRGNPVGAFGYIEYEDASKNKLVVMSRADIEKRKPKYASPEFWGGVKKTWENGRQVEVQVEGWEAEMFLKTMKREIYSAKHIPRDPMKIDDTYYFIKQREAQYAQMAAESEAIQHANTIDMTFDDDSVTDTDTTQALPEATIQYSEPEPTPQEEPPDAQDEPQEPESEQPKGKSQATQKAPKSGKSGQQQMNMSQAPQEPLPWEEEPDF